MKIKRFLCITIALIVAISMFTGCFNNSAEKNNPAVFSNEFFEITVPDDWLDRIVVTTTETEIKIYQKAAYEAFGGGWLCTIKKYDDKTYEVLPSYELIANLWKENNNTGNREDWYFVIEYPSDVQADVENEESMKEYFDMFEQIPGIFKNSSNWRWLAEPDDPA